MEKENNLYADMRKEDWIALLITSAILIILTLIFRLNLGYTMVGILVIFIIEYMKRPFMRLMKEVSD